MLPNQMHTWTVLGGKGFLCTSCLQVRTMRGPAWDAIWFAECPRFCSNHWQNIEVLTRGMNHKLGLGLMTPEPGQPHGRLCVACLRCGYYTQDTPRELAKPCVLARATTLAGRKHLDAIHAGLHPSARNDKMRADRTCVRVIGGEWWPFEVALHRLKDGLPPTEALAENPEGYIEEAEAG